MTELPIPDPKSPEETRLDRNLSELLQELRLAVPGVTILFGFLLAAPFQVRFSEVSGFQEGIYFATLLLAALSTILLIAPTAYHRVTFRLQMKRRLIPLANRVAIAGLVTLGLTITGAVVLVTDVLFGPVLTAVTGTASLLLFSLLWFVIPLSDRSHRNGDVHSQDST